MAFSPTIAGIKWRLIDTFVNCIAQECNPFEMEHNCRGILSIKSSTRMNAVEMKARIKELSVTRLGLDGMNSRLCFADAECYFIREKHVGKTPSFWQYIFKFKNVSGE